MKHAAALILCCLVSVPAWAEKYGAGPWTVDATTRGSRISGKVTGPHCKNLQLDLYTSRYGHATTQIKNVGQSRKFFETAAGVYGRGGPPVITRIYATCQD